MIDPSLFANPPAEFRNAPLWVWNDRMEEDALRAQLTDLRAHGFGGAFVHPRPGLVTEYLSEEWFSLWRTALVIAEELGMKLYIYDENSYPSGFAGGHVSKELPDCPARAVTVRKLDAASPMMNAPGRPVTAYAFEEGPDGRMKLTEDLTHIPKAEWSDRGNRFLVVDLIQSETTNWLGGYWYPDILRPEVATLFLSTTHEKYAAYFGDRFGTSVPAIFTDEPAPASGGVHELESVSVPFSFWFSSQFEERNGYDIRPYLPALFFDVEGSMLKLDCSKVRFDYYCTIRELWVNNFVRPISQWCSIHAIAYTGHYMEHQWPFPWGGMASPAVMSLYEYMDWPAIDMLMTYLLKDNGTDNLLLTVRELHSVANQFEKRRTLCEAYGAGGWDASLEDFRRIGDWLIVHGVNFINPHLSFSTIFGARKRDHPQSFDSREPWWDDYRDLADYQARLSLVLSQGRTVNRLLVLHPTTTAFVSTPAGPGFTEDAVATPDMSGYRRLIQQLTDWGIDFDLGDEFIIARHGSVVPAGTQEETAGLRIGHRTYQLVLVPRELNHLLGTTVVLLKDYLANGHTVLSLGAKPRYLDGVVSAAAAALVDHSGWRDVSAANIRSEIETRLHPRVRWGTADNLPPGVTHLRREYDDGSAFFFIVNSSPSCVNATIEVDGAGIEVWDPWTGSASIAETGASSGNSVLTGMRRVPHGSRLTIDLPSSGSLLLRAPAEGISPLANRSTVAVAATSVGASVDGTSRTGEQVVELRWQNVKPEEENVLPLDYCNLQVGSKKYLGIHTIYANQFVFEHHGFEADPWDNSVQYKSRWLDRKFRESSGFTAVYRFTVDATRSLPERVSLFVERGEEYTIAVNGSDIALSVPEPLWLDRHLSSADVTALLREGVNEITIHASPFSALMEVEAVYLRGLFGVAESDGRWVMVPPRRIGPGSWVKQGYPFYGGSFLYDAAVQVDAKPSRAILHIDEWEGTTATVIVNGRRAGAIGYDNSGELEIAKLLRTGMNRIKLRLSGSLKNLLGPHLSPDRPRRMAWPTAWKRPPMHGPPDPARYDFIDYGAAARIQLRLYRER